MLNLANYVHPNFRLMWRRHKVQIAAIFCIFLAFYIISNRSNKYFIFTAQSSHLPTILRQAVYQKRLKTCGADLAARHRHQQRGQSAAPELPVSQLRLLLESGPDPGDVALVSQLARRVEAAVTSIRVEEGQAILVPFGVNQL